MNLIKFLIILTICFGCNYNQTKAKTDKDKLGLDTTAGIYSVTEEDSAMNSAINKAKSTIAEFDEALKSNNSSYSSFAIKKRYNTTNDGGEHMWIAEIKIINGNYKGIVNNDAEETTEVKYGDTVTVHKDEITDWMYLDNNVLRGGYTIRAIRNLMSREDRLMMDKDLGFRIDD